MSPDSPSEKRQLVVHIGGMTCRSCELMLERKLKAVPGVASVHVNHRKGTATITALANNLPPIDLIRAVIHDTGYRLLEEDEAPSQNSSCHVASEEPGRKWMEIGAALVIILAIAKLLQAFDIVSLAPSTAGALTYGGIIVIGLVAGMSTCLAVAGGLLLAMAAKYHETHRHETPWQRFIPLLHFNVGRLVSYFFLGGLVGLLGQSITLSTTMTGYLNVIIALVMLYLGLTILHIIPKGSFPIHPPKALGHWIANLSESDHPAAPFALGALTFFLPCGFTQSLQLVALASGSFMSGAFTMFTFALGTLPSLLGISAISSHAKGTSSRLFLRFAGTLVVLLALFNLQNGLALAGVELPFPTPEILRRSPATRQAALPPAGKVQTVRMAVGSYGYEPSELTIRAGTPVRWIVDGTNASGCTRGIVIPSLGIRRILNAGENVIEFTAQNPGRLPFSCSMGMVRGAFNVI